MKVVHIPHFEGNPYQRELNSALKSRGIESELLKGYPAPMIKYFITNNPDIVHFHWISHYLVSKSRLLSYLKATVFFVFVIFLKLFGIRIVWTVHNIVDHESKNDQIELNAKRLFVRFCDSLIVHCENAEQIIKFKLGIDSGKTSIIPHGNFINTYPNSISPETARNELGLPSNSLVYLFFGQIRPYKRVVPLIEAFSELDDEDKRLLIAGNPINSDLRESVRNLASQDDRVTIDLRYIPDQEIQQYMNAADVVIIPYKDVLTSGSVMLAMSFSKAVIAPANGCNPDTLRTQRELLYKPDSRSIRKAMELAENENLSDIGNKNFQHAKHFDWNKIASLTERTYQMI